MTQSVLRNPDALLLINHLRETDLGYMYQQRASHFDEELVLRFIQAIGIYPVGSCVQMNTGHIGLVISVHPNHRLKPMVLVVLDADGRQYPVPAVIDLLTQGVAAQSASLEIRSAVSPPSTGSMSGNTWPKPPP